MLFLFLVVFVYEHRLFAGKTFLVENKVFKNARFIQAAEGQNTYLTYFPWLTLCLKVSDSANTGELKNVRFLSLV